MVRRNKAFFPLKARQWLHHAVVAGQSQQKTSTRNMTLIVQSELQQSSLVLAFTNHKTFFSIWTHFKHFQLHTVLCRVSLYHYYSFCYCELKHQGNADLRLSQQLCAWAGQLFCKSRKSHPGTALP